MTGLRSFDAIDVGDGTSVLLDRSCGTCPSCRGGATLWCSRPAGGGRTLTSPVPTASVTALREAVLAAAALLEAPRGGTVVVVGEDGSPQVVMARRVVADVVLAAPLLADQSVRAQVAAREPSGRAPVIVAGADVRAAVRAVRRGGHVCVPAPSSGSGSIQPSVTELVQREVTLVAPRRVTDVLDRMTRDAWAATVAAA
ncbi:hypothetical protein [Nocardioides sp. SYSU DS0663]|uniref:hypothetical protein n=1 Tax=Nocardioides sp. SYSU DS0663 TaxID=3416445 RepID=UPI003F4C1E7C